MSLIAELRLTSPELPLTESLSAVPDMRLKVEQVIAERPELPIMFLWASGDDFTTFENALSTDITIRKFVLLEDASERRLYRVHISDQTSTVMYPTDLEVGASRLAVTATVRGIDVRIRFPDRNALRCFRDICDKKGISISLRGLYDGNDSSAQDRYGLSAKQQRTLQRASESGYYQVPRKVGLDDLAEDLDISRQAVSERLRRGTDVLIQNVFETMESDPGMYQSD